MPHWKSVVRNYFSFNKRERRGLYVLITIVFLLIAIRLFLEFRSGNELSVNFQALPSLEVTADSIESKRENQKDAHSITPISWTKFDPNTVTTAQLTSFGLDSSVAKRWHNYRAKGGTFRRLGDIQKLYGIDSAWVVEAEDFISFPAKPIESNDRGFQPRRDTLKKTPEVSIIELNSADTSELLALPWIGAYYAKEIIELRNRMGGFFSYDQLTEVYRIRDESIESIIDHSTIDTSLVHKISLNKCDVSQLGRHPYISWKQAKIVINYRLQHGGFTQKRDILKTDVISDSVYLKIAPYLIIE